MILVATTSRLQASLLQGPRGCVDVIRIAVAHVPQPDAGGRRRHPPYAAPPHRTSVIAARLPSSPLQMEKGLKTKANWDSFALKVFCEICKEEVSAGNRPVASLSATGYKNLQQKFFARTGRNYEKKQFKNRWDTLKKEYRQWVTFTQAATGQRWDSKLGTVVADNEWWAKHIEAHPECVKFRNGPPENLADLVAIFDKAHVTVATSAILGEHIEVPMDLVEVEDGDDDMETNNSASQKAKGAEKRKAATIVASPKKKQKEQKNHIIQEFRHVANIMAGSTSVTSSSAVPRGHGIKDVIKLAVQSGAKECSDLFFTATKLFMNADYREMFSALETNEGRLDWLNRMHEEMKKNLCIGFSLASRG